VIAEWDVEQYVTNRKINCSKKTYLAQDLIPLLAHEVAEIVKVELPKLATAIKLAAHLTPNLHDRSEHLVIAVTCK